MSLKSDFLKIYADLPLGARREIIAVVGNEPVTWNSAMVEIENNTKIGQEILEQLISLGILNGQN
ncbi:MAG: hypothetical protein WCV93_04735 [Candidatus Shapirobacteria bacterium]|jgi:hypothetical protein